MTTNARLGSAFFALFTKFETREITHNKVHVKWVL
jgi:hypothetical protein